MRFHQKIYSRPVMAVLLNSETMFSLKKQIAKPWIQLLAEANKEVNTTLYFFLMKDVNLKDQKISGCYWHKGAGKWLQQDFPFPDIFYIRCGVAKRYTRTYKELCKIIRSKNGKLITHYTFNKWRLYEVLSQDPVMKRYLPATRTVQQADDIKKMLQHYKVVYLKSHIGRKGENVLRVEVLPDGGYKYSYYKSAQLTVKSIPDYQTLLNVVNTFFRGRSFLIQQGIRLLKFKNRLVDMRAELQHNGKGGLDIVGISVRCGQPYSPITTHGEAFSFDSFFVNIMGYSKEKLEAFRSEVHKFLISIYEYLENNYGKYAEIGIDFAIDPNQQIWFIEANSRSTKVSLNMAYGDKVLYKNSKTILEYAKFLFDQSKKSIKKTAANDFPQRNVKPTQKKTDVIDIGDDSQDEVGQDSYSSNLRYLPICFKEANSRRAEVFFQFSAPDQTIETVEDNIADAFDFESESLVIRN